MISNKDYTDVWGIKLRDSPVVEVMCKSTAACLKQEIVSNSSVLEYLDHVEHVESLLGSLRKHGLENELLTLFVVAHGHVIEAVCSVNDIVALFELFLVFVNNNSTFIGCE